MTAVVPGPNATRARIVVDWAQQSEAATRALGLDFRYAELAPDADHWSDAFAGFAATPGNALSVVESPYFLAQSMRLGQLSLRHRWPAVFSFRKHVEDGGLMSYGIDLQHIWERSAFYVARILDGARPRHLPVEQPTNTRSRSMSRPRRRSGYLPAVCAAACRQGDRVMDRRTVVAAAGALLATPSLFARKRRSVVWSVFSAPSRTLRSVGRKA